jgi:hypothetical protein
MNLFRFYEQLEFALNCKLDIAAIPNNEVQELFDDLNDLISTAREAENKGVGEKTIKDIGTVRKIQ